MTPVKPSTKGGQKLPRRLEHERIRRIEQAKNEQARARLDGMKTSKFKVFGIGPSPGVDPDAPPVLHGTLTRRP